jgi:hypothetical protein
LERANDQRYALVSALDAAEDKLREALQYHPTDQVYAFLNNKPQTAKLRLGEAETARQQASELLQQKRELVAAIEAEIEDTKRHLENRRYQLRDALGAVVCTSDEFLALFQRIQSCWVELRSLRLTITRGLPADWSVAPWATGTDPPDPPAY